MAFINYYGGLNPSMDKTKFDELATVITHKPNGFTTFNISEFNA